MTDLLVADNIDKQFDIRKGLVERLLKPAKRVHAVNNVSFTVERGETLGLIGESGCGKSTLARVLLRLQEPTGGRILFDGNDITKLPAKELIAYRRRMQIVFQDPYASLNPRKTVEQIVGLPLKIHEKLGARAMRDRVAQILEKVGLSADHLERFPHQFSGGQRQRISIARALILNPEFVVCDEAVSALDASVQAQILLLLTELRRSLSLTYLFISHNIAVVGYISDRVAVMYLGEIVEMGPSRAVVARPQHPYTQMLMAALPRLDGQSRRGPQRATEPPSPLNRLPGCPFQTRCSIVQAVCRETPPPLRATGADRLVACHFAETHAAELAS
jgi:oligopeptide/dipeptide ABC transporter ATP-binding protein